VASRAGKRALVLGIDQDPIWFLFCYGEKGVRMRMSENQQMNGKAAEARKCQKLQD
jgi:hypothetical protein